MKIIVTASSPDLNSNVDTRFGRGANFVVVDPETLEWQAYPNPGVSASGGAGTLAAQFAANQQASAIISGDFGPNAYDALHAAGISMYLLGDCATVMEAIERYKASRLERVDAPTSQGHHGRG